MKKPTVISLFSGAGGLDYGFEAAGFETRVAVEMNADACKTLKLNRPKWAVLQDDIMRVSSQAILEAARLKAGEASVLIGGPPCQPFSKAGYWSRGDALRLEDPRANTLGAYLRVLEDTLPDSFVLENVEGLAYRNKDEGLNLLMDAFKRINRKTGARYEVRFEILNAASYGVPQLRKRMIIVGSKGGRSFEFPKSTHGDPAKGFEPPTTAWDALHDVGPSPSEDLAPRGKWADLLPSIPEGENYLWHTDRMAGKPLFGWRSRYWSFLLKLAKSLPSWTIQAQPGPAIGPFHWENRRLSVREMCRIQTFPDDVQIVGGRTSIQRQIGNAVPSLLGELLGRGIRQQFLGAPLSETGLTLIPRRGPSIPTPEPVARVPRKFLDLVGKHAAHAGPGKGPGAGRRSP